MNELRKIAFFSNLLKKLVTSPVTVPATATGKLLGGLAGLGSGFWFPTVATGASTYGALKGAGAIKDALSKGKPLQSKLQAYKKKFPKDTGKPYINPYRAKQEYSRYIR